MDLGPGAPANRARDGVWRTDRRALTVGLVFTVTLVAFEGLAVITILPVIERDLHHGSLIGWVVSAFFLGNLFGAVAAGYDADRHGPARPLAAGLVLFAAGLLAGGLAPNMYALLAARAVQGVGGGAILPVAYAAVGRAYPTTLQPRMFAVLSSAWVVPGLVGPSISAAVAETLGWRWVFLGLLPLVGLAAVMTLRALHALGPPGGASPEDRRARAFVLVAGAALFLSGVSLHNPIATPALAVAGLLVGVRAFLRLVPEGTTRLAAGLPAAVALRGLTAFAFFGTDTYVSVTVKDVRHASLALASAAVTSATLTWTTGSWIQERRVGTAGPRAFVRAGLACIAIGIGAMIAVATAVVPDWFAMLAWGVAGLGMGLAYSAFTLVVLAQAPKGGEGTASGALQLCETLGITLGSGVTGAIAATGTSLGSSRGTGLAVGFALCAAVALAAVAASARVPDRLVSTQDLDEQDPRVGDPDDELRGRAEREPVEPAPAAGEERDRADDRG